MGRLFWKFFIFIALAHLVGIVGISASFWINEQAYRRREASIDMSPPASTNVEAAALTLTYGGETALRSFLAHSQNHTPLVVDETGRDILEREVDPQALSQALSLPEPDRARSAVRHVALPNGKSYWLYLSRPTGAGNRPPPPGMDRRPGGPNARGFVPITPLVINLLASLAFAFALAWYFSRPIRTLRNAFDALADGDLSLRIAPQMGSRRDELADLGHDFDRMAARLQTLIGSQRRLLHDVSHEMRSPLARLQASIGLARQQPERTEATLARIELECERMDRLVGELLTLSRLEARVDAGATENVEMANLLEELFEDASFEATAANRHIMALRCDAAQVEGQPELLHRALENVVRNAIRHTPEGCAVMLEAIAHHDSGKLLIAIEDEGSGVAESELETIFEPFRRGSEQTDGNGHGLGLAIARRVIEMHDGSICARNRSEGGLRVEIELPLAGVSAPSAA